MKQWLKAWWFIIVSAVLLCGSGIIPAIIPQAVPAANKTGNATKFQLASGSFTNGNLLKYDANGNAIDGAVALTGVVLGAGGLSVQYVIPMVSGTPGTLTASPLTSSAAGTITDALNAIGTTPSAAFSFSNITAAALGAQQYSPASEWLGNGWGVFAVPTAPTSAAPTPGGACDAGTHLWAVTFVNAFGETTIGAASASQDCTTNHTVPLSAIPTGPIGTTHRILYRTKAGTTTPYFLLYDIADNLTTIYSDVSSDASLGVQPPAVNGTGNSQTVAFRSYVVPVQSDNPVGYWGLESSINGAAWVPTLTVTSDAHVGIRTLVPITALHAVGNGSGFPATSGTVQSAGHIVRLRDTSAAVLDFGGNGGFGYWVQSTYELGLNTNFPLFLNPNGGPVGIGALAVRPGSLLEVAGIIQTDAQTGDPGCTAVQDIGKIWFDSTSAVTTVRKTCVAVTSTPTWVTF